MYKKVDWGSASQTCKSFLWVNLYNAILEVNLLRKFTSRVSLRELGLLGRCCIRFANLLREFRCANSDYYSTKRYSVKNHTDVLIISLSEQVQTQVCAGAPQICVMADANLIFATLR